MYVNSLVMEKKIPKKCREGDMYACMQLIIVHHAQLRQLKVKVVESLTNFVCKQSRK